MDSVKIFPEGTEVIRREDIKSTYKIVIIPHSVQTIEDEAFYGLGCDVYYVGTTAEFAKIKFDSDICTPCVNCVDGGVMLHL